MARSNDNTLKKATRLSIIRTIEQKHRQFSKMKRRQKMEVLEKVAEEIGVETQTPTYSQEELIGLEPIPSGIFTLQEMSQLIEDKQHTVIRLDSPTRRRNIQDPFLKKLDALLDDTVLNELLAPPGFTPGKRRWMPAQLLRIELLRTFRFSSWSTRDFCKYISCLLRKEERAFCRLPLNKLDMCDHSRLSTFRSSLTMEMRINLTVYFMNFFLKSGHIGEKQVHMIDSTDVAIPIADTPISKITVEDGTFIRFYSDLNSDVGARRRKRNKSNKFIGYRVHTITVGDMDSGIAYPVVSVASAASQNDAMFLEPLVQIAQQMGVDMKVLLADKAYSSAPRQERVKKDLDVLMITPPMGNAVIPENVTRKSGAVFQNENCETKMRWAGFDSDDNVHIFKCNNDGDCPNFYSCDKERLLKTDTGLFGMVPQCSSSLEDALWSRKIAERPFNLMKHRDGLEPCKMKTHRTVSAQVVFSQIVGLTYVMAGLRSSKKKRQKGKQEVLPLAMAN